MNDFAYVIKEITLSAYADDTQIFYADKDSQKVEQVINNDLERVDVVGGTRKIRWKETTRNTKQWSWTKEIKIHYVNVKVRLFRTIKRQIPLASY